MVGSAVSKILVMHEGYGCETGCCGHVIYIDGSGPPRRRFHFAHPYDEDPLEWAKKLIASEVGEEHVADLDWENCRVLDEC